jgi:hypothetical protein
MKTLTMTRGISAALLAILLAACGGGNGSSGTPAVRTSALMGGDPGAATTTVNASATAPSTLAALAYPIPADMWSAPSGATPSSGNYVYLQSDSGDYIGGGRTYNYTNANALMTYTSTERAINLNLQGNQNWRGSFVLPSGAGSLQAGYFANLTRAPFANPAVGGLEWSGEGRGCNTLSGWIVIDKVTVTSGAMTELDLRFEQHCEGGSNALRGQIHWTMADATSGPAAGPAAIPETLWQPAVTALPATGNYMYLESQAGDYIGSGRTYTYTPTNASLALSASGARLGVRVTGDQSWSGTFQGMQGISKLAVGYYAGLSRYPFHNPVLGGMDWSGNGRGCNTLNGWFAVDKITYNGSTLTAVDLRFEQYCDGNTSPLRGKLHWTIGENTTAPGPQDPPPANLWKPDASFVPPTGNYVFLVSDAGDYIGAGRTQLLTTGNTTITADVNRTAAFGISAGGWYGDFVGMNSISQLKPGYYGKLQRYPFNNPSVGGLNWSGNGRGCNTLTGWFVIDKVSYTLGAVTAVDLRFEQHCEGGVAAQRGKIHWEK